MEISQSGTFTDPRDGKTYRTVRIGKQVWMSENLNYPVSGSKCYGDVTYNCAKYGLLYSLEAAKKACPSGWHLPTREEWQILIGYAGDDVAGLKLKAKSGWPTCDVLEERYIVEPYGTSDIYELSQYEIEIIKSMPGWPNSYSYGGTDEYGFSALPGGRGFSGGSFDYVGNYGSWWSATNADYLCMGSWWDIEWLSYGTGGLFSVRCVRD